MWFRSVWVIGLVLGTALAPACGGNDNNNAANSSAGGTPGQNDNAACDVISLDVVRSTLGIPDLEAPTATVVTSQTTCMYPQGSNPDKVSISYNKGMTLDSFNSERARTESGLSLTTTDVTGLGDAAYSLTLGSGSLVTNAMVVLKGSTRVMLTSSATLDQEKQLLTLIVAEL
jgi:hypothetical protein